MARKVPAAHEKQTGTHSRHHGENAPAQQKTVSYSTVRIIPYQLPAVIDPVYLNSVRKLRIWNDTMGQDLIEYALMAGFVAVAAGAIMPGVAASINTIFSKVNSIMTLAAAS